MNEDKSYFERDKRLLLNTYSRIPIDISHGEGVYLFTNRGKRYLDFFSGLAVNAVGYNNPKIKEAISIQLGKFNHISNYYFNSAQVDLAELILKFSDMARVFFTNSGTEAVEAAIKLIRKKHGADKEIISFINSFHGRTYGALSISGKDKYKMSFSPMLTNIKQIRFNDVEELKNCIRENTAALFIEFIQGEGGVNVLSSEFAEEVKRLQLKYNITIVADEVQTGLGRTGKPFAFNHYNIKPDIILIAKALGGGLPLGAMLTSEQYSQVFTPGDHGSTFGGNPVACAAGKAVMEEIFEVKLYEQVSELGEYFISELEILKDRYPEKILDVRGMGFMIGIEMQNKCTKVVEGLREKQILVNCTNENVLRILPPLISQKKDIDFFLYKFDETLRSS
ncbi:MAG: acetylornithine/succinylornithine family transaminase [Ignavibacteria bacterium]|nr:acetylornithine/succinylornithine family transaminase [Ignavibacteria bacterium]MBT8381687.1 acetylornithine/succinylornithine family transaminase [Ignavibacteria bacterium]MBT8390308.1 acetylornithine/succinylornithine family transaminase [Ignavibacteria bacterium]NNJ53075.1 acetylornithine/succinylornithine family transaminase [Ignavibacteriaceae bacterium]NNL20279.1 acetylornithine/succinylornithine family transaminase [Ignavibacteriaceae bacterium]